MRQREREREREKERKKKNRMKNNKTYKQKERKTTNTEIKRNIKKKRNKERKKNMNKQLNYYYIINHHQAPLSHYESLIASVSWSIFGKPQTKMLFIIIFYLWQKSRGLNCPSEVGDESNH